MVFSVSGAFVPLIGLVTGNLLAQCSILAAITLITALILCIPTQPEALPAPAHAFAPRYKVTRTLARYRVTRTLSPHVHAPQAFS